MNKRMRATAAAVTTALAAALIGVSGGSAGATTARLDDAVARDLARLDGSAPYAAFVHFGASTPASRAAVLADAGLDAVSDYDVVDATFAHGPSSGFDKLRDATGVEYIEANRDLHLNEDTAGWATGYEVARKPIAGGPYRTGGGAIIDGTGVGVAIVDSGFDASHPDLGAIEKNFQFACSKILVTTGTEECFPRPIDLGPDGRTDTSSGHGTFTAGLAAGDGTASSGAFTGAAPGASVYGFAAGAGLNVLNAVESLNHIYVNYDSFTPRIKVINNSWGNAAGSPYDPDGIIEGLMNQLIADKGVTLVFAANNDGGDGSEDNTNSYCKNPTPGVICVANYDDLGTGSRDGELDISSARGKQGQTNTYPDISAPGSSVISTCGRTSGWLCSTPVLVSPALAWEPYYGIASGTSASAPIVTGAVALLLQANPSLTPAQIEDIVLDSARKFDVTPPTGYEADPQNPGSTTSFDKGAGLLDIPAALAAAGAVAGGATAGPVTLVANDGGDITPNGATDIVSATANPGATGVTYTVTVRNAADQGLISNSLRLFQNVAGTTYRTNVTITATGATPNPPEAVDDPATAEAASASRAGNTVTFFVPYAEIGNPAVGEAANSVWVASYTAVIADAAPGPSGGTAADFVVRPGYAAYTVR